MHGNMHALSPFLSPGMDALGTACACSMDDHGRSYRTGMDAPATTGFMPGGTWGMRVGMCWGRREGRKGHRRHRTTRRLGGREGHGGSGGRGLTCTGLSNLSRAQIILKAAQNQLSIAPPPLRASSAVILSPARHARASTGRPLTRYRCLLSLLGLLGLLTLSIMLATPWAIFTTRQHRGGGGSWQQRLIRNRAFGRFALRVAGGVRHRPGEPRLAHIHERDA